MASAHVAFADEIGLLQDNLLEMATCADTMVAAAVEAFMNGDLDQMQDVERRDDTVDRLDLEIENKCLCLIARHQPVARDLRVIGTALKVSTDIERIADYAVDIAKIGRRLALAQEIYYPLVDLQRLTLLSRIMLHDALNAFVHHDLALVEQVIQADDAVDKLYHDMRTRLTDILVEGSHRALLALNLLLAAQYMERISDHVVNIAERVCFIETGALKQVEIGRLPLAEPCVVRSTN